MGRVEDITRRKLESDGKILTMSETSVYRELTQELNRCVSLSVYRPGGLRWQCRYPLVGRTVAETPKLNDPAFAQTVRGTITRILREDRGEKQTDSGKSSQIQRKPSVAPAHHCFMQTAAPRTVGTPVNGILKPSLSVQTNGDGKGEASKVQTNGIAPKAENAQQDPGYESEDSAMLESPLSEKNPLEAAA